MSDLPQDTPIGAVPPPEWPEDAGTSFFGPKDPLREASTAGSVVVFDAGTSDPTLARYPSGVASQGPSQSWGAETLDRETVTDIPVPMPGSASGYRTRRLIGQGGVGEVWEAEQLSLGRTVAIKRMRADRVDAKLDTTPRNRLRQQFFQREAKTAAHLDHPNILPVYDLGLDEERNPVIAMKLITGVPWSRLLRDDFTRLSVEQFLQKHLAIFIDVVQAVAFAHSRGIVHRDIKPSQVMVGDYGEVQLIDWGLALSMDPAALPDKWRPTNPQLAPNIATASSPAGTAAFMAPEQTENTAQNVGPWTDLFLLGGTLYNLLTGQTPYTGQSSRQAFAQASVGQIEPIARAAAGRPIPEELAILVAELMVFDWRQRHLTAADLLHRLNEYRSGALHRREATQLVQQVREELDHAGLDYNDYEHLLSRLDRSLTLWASNPDVAPLEEQVHQRYAKDALKNGDFVLARLHTQELQNLGERVVLRKQIEAQEAKRARREEQRRAAIFGVLILAVCSFVLAAFAWRQMRVAERARILAEESQDVATREQYLAAIGYANASIESLNTRRAREALQSAPEKLRSWEWNYLNKRTSLYSDSIKAPSLLIAVAWSPDGDTIALGGETKALNLFSLKNRTMRPLVGHQDKIYGVRFSADGKQLLSTSKDKTARLWDVASGECLRVFEGHTDFVYTAVFHPTRREILTGSRDWTARIWDLDSTASMVLKGHTQMVFWAEYTHGGDRVLTSARDRTFRTWNAKTGEPLETVKTTHRSGLTSAVTSPDGKLILTTSWDSDAKIFDAETLEEKSTLRLHTDSIFRSLFSKDGERVITLSHDGTFAIWDLASFRPIARFAAHEGYIWDGQFSPDGSRLITAGYDGVAYIWDLAEIDPTPATVTEVPTTEDWGEALQVSAFYSADSSYDSLDDRWTPRSGARLMSAANEPVIVKNGQFAFNSEGTRHLKIGEPAVVVDETSAAIALLSPSKVTAAYFAESSPHVFAATSDGAAVYSTTSWKPEFNLPATPPVKIARLSPDGKLLALGRSASSAQQSLEVYRLPDVRPIHRDAGNWGHLTAMTFCQHNRHFAYAIQTGWEIRKVDLEGVNPRQNFIGHSNRVLDLVFSNDDKRLFSVALDSTIRVWTTDTGREILLLKEQTGDQYIGLALSPDNELLLAPSNAGRLYVFQAP